MRTWFITGVSRGLGRAIAQAALNEGDAVIGTVRDGAPDLAAGPGKLQVVKLDVTDGEAVDAAVVQAFASAGKIDVIVNNAGCGLLGALEKATDAEAKRLFEVDVFAPFRIIREPPRSDLVLEIDRLIRRSDEHALARLDDFLPAVAGAIALLGARDEGFQRLCFGPSKAANSAISISRLPHKCCAASL
jgi:NAD(P)-dependent dehydrogenase (short-subunit alcohol dehydrogenase family)